MLQRKVEYKVWARIMSHLLYFKLTFARPVEKDITIPSENNEEYFIDFGGGDRERIDIAFKSAMINQLHT